MTITAEYIGDLDKEKHEKIVEASGADSHDSTYHLSSKTHRLKFKAPDQATADLMRDRIEHTGIEFSKLAISE